MNTKMSDGMPERTNGFSPQIMTIKDVIDDFEDHKIIVPPTQRAYAWKDIRTRRGLIQSLLVRNPIGTIVVNEVPAKNEFDKKKWYIYDGQCRLRTLYSFIYGVRADNLNNDGTAPSIPVAYPDTSDMTEEHHVYYYDETNPSKKYRFVDYKEKERINIFGYKIYVTVCNNYTPEQLNRLFVSLNKGKPLNHLEKIWSMKDLYPAKNAIDYFYNEAIEGCRTPKELLRVLWKIDKIDDKQGNDNIRNKSVSVVANAIQLYFTAAFGKKIWRNIDENADNARVKFMEQNYYTLAYPVDNKLTFDETETHKILDSFVKQVEEIKYGLSYIKKKTHYKELWKVNNIAGFVLFNIILEPNHEQKLTDIDYLQLIAFCNNETVHKDDNFSPLQRLEHIFKCHDDFLYIEHRQRKDDNFRCKHLFNWEDGLLNAKQCIKKNKVDSRQTISIAVIATLNK